MRYLAVSADFWLLMKLALLYLIDFAVEDSSHELMLENRLLQAQKLETIGALAGGYSARFQ